MLRKIAGILVAFFCGLCGGNYIAQPAETSGKSRIEAALRAVVKVDTKSVPGARSGNGVLIDAEHVLTIGYLVMEADDVEITDHAGQKFPGVLAGYDHATGFGLVRLLVPSKITPAALGSSSDLATKSPVLIVPFGGARTAQPAFVVSKRAFVASWEYMLDEAVFTAPPILEWGGAGLFAKDGALVGIGSLFCAMLMAKAVQAIWLFRLIF